MFVSGANQKLAALIKVCCCCYCFFFNFNFLHLHEGDSTRLPMASTLVLHSVGHYQPVKGYSLDAEKPRGRSVSGIV